MSFLFEKKYIKYLRVYKTPIGPNQLDPFIFPVAREGEEPRLIPSIHAQITKDLEIFTGGQPQRIKNYYLVGPACNPRSKSRHGELRIIIELNKDLKDIDIDGLLSERILKLAKELSGKLATGTTRKINYIVTIRPIRETQYEGIYDIPNFSWIRTPSGLTK